MEQHGSLTVNGFLVYAIACQLRLMFPMHIGAARCGLGDIGAIAELAQLQELQALQNDLSHAEWATAVPGKSAQ